MLVITAPSLVSYTIVQKRQQKCSVRGIKGELLQILGIVAKPEGSVWCLTADA